MKKILLYLVLTFVLSGCAGSTIPEGSKTSGQPVPQHQHTRSPQTQIDLSLRQGDYSRALRLLGALQEQGGWNQQFEDTWAQAFAGLLAQAEQRLAQKDYPVAGRLYSDAIDNLQKNSARLARRERDLLQLNKQLDYCADQLLERGLLVYRSGKLQQALAIWEQINKFHPQHTASQRAINTTRRQLHNLEALSAE
ncbi:membrane lipoprotein lipid attachment site-containing protein [Geopsychrobacter electrodiphilus]|uniref:membrane lipoprotein lipid attachment site-containing protein n=1 Tax=Geopsychrobacter electrodiphilus TaxID=225196 RepID=UPI000371ABC6|nr:membrane lipoprotein lipid attachment site-containing protein [Geopsychrobacter electrodiphilus]